jgi:hypothetical protein
MTPQEWLAKNPNALLCTAFVNGQTIIFITQNRDNADEIMHALAADETFHGGSAGTTLYLTDDPPQGDAEPMIG